MVATVGNPTSGDRDVIELVVQLSRVSYHVSYV